MKLIYGFVFLMLLTAETTQAQSCETTNLVHYQYNDIKKILEKNSCQNCHFKGNQNDLWVFDTYQDLMAKGKCGPVIDHGSPLTSLLVDKLNEGSLACGYSMPLGAEPISSRDLLAIETWILVGAPEFCIPTFDEVKEILTVNQCQNCHQNFGEWRFDSYDKLFVKPSNSLCPDPVIVPFKSGQSLLYKKISGESSLCGQKMPIEGTMVYTDIARIRDWINSGAFQSSPSLPVVLTDFSAENKENTSVFLYWQSSSEYNTAYYAIEYSPDGIQFTEIGVRDAVSQSGQLTNYEFYDLSPGFGNQYYRLRIMDHDGQFTYSPTRAVRIKNNQETLKLYPSSLQANQPLFIEWLPSIDEERTRIHFMDILGREVFSLVISPGVNSTTVPNLNPGLYYAVIQPDFENYLVKKMIMIY